MGGVAHSGGKSVGRERSRLLPLFLRLLFANMGDIPKINVQRRH